MIVNRLYLAYALCVVSLLALGQYRGWSFDKVNVVKDVPRSIRDNPGSYRSVYGAYSHYTGGK